MLNLIHRYAKENYSLTLLNFLGILNFMVAKATLRRWPKTRTDFKSDTLFLLISRTRWKYADALALLLHINKGLFLVKIPFLKCILYKAICSYSYYFSIKAISKLFKALLKAETCIY